ncbi:MAG: putative protease [Labilithrix sp.]|nr:putative protease [Labilithrix sp.]
MSDEDPHDDFPSDPLPSGSGKETVRESAKERVRARLESVIPEILKRAIEIGVEKARESPDNLKQFVHDLKVPKEVAHYLLQQIDDTKNGLFRVVAKEIRDFLEHTNFSGELQKLLTTVQFEVNTTIRFTPNDGREPRKNNDGGDDELARDEPAEASEGEGEGAEHDREPPSRRPLPRPEVKTSVNVRRDGADAQRSSPRGRGSRSSP